MCFVPSLIVYFSTVVIHIFLWYIYTLFVLFIIYSMLAKTLQYQGTNSINRACKPWTTPLASWPKNGGWEGQGSSRINFFKRIMKNWNKKMEVLQASASFAQDGKCFCLIALCQLSKIKLLRYMTCIIAWLKFVYWLLLYQN